MDDILPINWLARFLSSPGVVHTMFIPCAFSPYQHRGGSWKYGGESLAGVPLAT